MDYEHPKLKAWRVAEQAARSIEREVRNLLINRAKGEIPVGVEDKMAAAVALRATAHQMLEEALRDVEVSAKALHYRNVTTPTIRPLDAASAWSLRWDERARQTAPEAIDGRDGRERDEHQDTSIKSDDLPAGAGAAHPKSRT